MSEYRRLDFSKLNFSDNTISYEEAVKDSTFKLIDIDLDGEELLPIDEKVICLTS